MSGGYYRMQRGWMDNPVLQADRSPANRREAWIWLIEHAAFAARQVTIGPRRIALERGQLAHTYRYLAAAWRWDLAKVRRFLIALVTESMIDTASDTHATVITICKYADYQASDGWTDTGDDTRTDSTPTQPRHGGDTNQNQGNQGKEGRESGEASPPPPSAAAALSGKGPADLFAADVVQLVDPAAEAVALWNELARERGLAVVRVVTSQRRMAVRMRLRDCGGIDGWRVVLSHVAASSFLCGENDRRWRADFDFVVQPKNLAKILEGAYARRKGKPGKANLDWMRERYGAGEAPIYEAPIYEAPIYEAPGEPA